ncbi:unnamed protein product [marine sediment metagenome]|uniref:Uncharacterized protein n=1 Tax=marine sediment metagenome TaxID=412755 RepID=X1EP25_9ZZZZ
MKKIEEISQRLIRGQEKLKEIKEKYNNDSKKIAELIQKRAILLADEVIESNSKRKKEIDERNKEIENLKRDIESRGPELISALEKKIQGIQTEKTNEELRLSFERQKIVGKKAVDLSKKLIEELEACNLINDELRKVWTEYANLSQVTKKGVIKPEEKTTLGSFECLRMLKNTLKYEFDTGKPRSCQQCRIMQW